MTETMMREASISFPMLGNLTINPKAYFTVFGFDIYWYGVILAAAFITALFYCSHRAKDFGLTEDDIFEEILWMLPLGVIGCRIYFVLFQWDYYSQHLNEIFKLRDGGIAMYGGIIAGIIFLLIWTKKKKLPLGAVLDVDGVGLILAQCIGRWGNFMNREAFGTQTDIFCRMGLTNPGAQTIYVHPTFLYESLWNLAGFIFLHIWSKKGHRKYDGQLFIIYVLWYGLGRGWIEGLRTDSLWLIPGVIRVSQLVAISTAIIMAVILIVQSRRPHPPEKLYVNRVRAAAAAQSAAPEAEPSANADTGLSADEDTQSQDAAPASADKEENNNV